MNQCCQSISACNQLLRGWDICGKVCFLFTIRTKANTLTEYEYPERYTPSDVWPSKLSIEECDEIVAKVLRDNYYCGLRGQLLVKIVNKLMSRHPGDRKDGLDGVARFEGKLAREGYFGPDQIPRS